MQLRHAVPQALCPLQHVTDLVLQDLGIQKLFAVFPFIQGLAFIQALVALHADQRQVQQGGGGKRQLCFAHTGAALHQDWFAQVAGDQNGRGDLA